MLVLAFDTATNTATAAVIRDGDVVGERLTTAGKLLAALDELLGDTGAVPADAGAIVVGTGPGRYTSLRMGIVIARSLALSLDVPIAGVSTLDALAAGAEGALPVLDARRREIFTLAGGRPAVLRPEELEPAPKQICVGDGALRYRDVLEARGAIVPSADDPRHIPRARQHARLASAFGTADSVDPIYLRVPDADHALARRAG
jgi:tRNA threonylcarbamoyladenosine biosynthesis protein TsaB